MSSLDPKTALRILDQLEPLIAQKIRLELLSVFDIEKNVRKNVLADFINGQAQSQKGESSSINQYSISEERHFEKIENSHLKFNSEKLDEIDKLINYGERPKANKSNRLHKIDNLDKTTKLNILSELSDINNSEPSDTDNLGNPQNRGKLPNPNVSEERVPNSQAINHLLLQNNKSGVNERSFKNIPQETNQDNFESFETNFTQIADESSSTLRLYNNDLKQETILNEEPNIENNSIDSSDIFSFEQNESRVSIPFQTNIINTETGRFNFLLTLKNKTVADLLKKERPSIIAVILKTFPDEFNKELLKHFDPEKRLLVEQYSSRIKESNKLLMKELEDELYRICYCSQCKIVNR